LNLRTLELVLPCLRLLPRNASNGQKALLTKSRKEALAMLKKLRTQKVTIPDVVLPEHWRWASSIASFTSGCRIATIKLRPTSVKVFILVRTTDIRNGRMDLANTRKISEETYAYRAGRMPQKVVTSSSRVKPDGGGRDRSRRGKGVPRATVNADKTFP